MRLENSVDVASSSAAVVDHRHRCATEDVEIGYHAPALEPITQPPERVHDRTAIKQHTVISHATSNSWRATNTPRRRNAAGA